MFEKHLQDITIFKKQLGFFQLTGTVLSANRHQRTSTHVSGGESYNGPNGRETRGIHVSTSSVMIDTIWLVDDKGKESKHRFVDYEVRKGSDLTIIFCSTDSKKKSGWHVAVANHTESNVVDFGALKALGQDKKFSAPKTGHVIALISCPIISVLLGAIAGYSNPYIWGFVGFLVGLFIAIMNGKVQVEEAEELLSDHIGKMGQGILKTFSKKQAGVEKQARLEIPSSAKLQSNHIAAELERLHKLKTDGVITEKEFAVLKTRALTGA